MTGLNLFGLRAFLPEAILLVLTLAALPAGVFRHPYFAKINANRLVFSGLILSLLFLFVFPAFPTGTMPTEAPYVLFVREMLLITGITAMAYGVSWLQYKKFSRFEYGVLLSFSLFGLMLAVSAEDFMMMFLGLEAAQTPLCFMIAYKRQGERSTEAGAKYVIVAMLSSAFLMFGISVLYVCTGSVAFSQIAAADKALIMPSFLMGVVFVVSGLFLRLGAAPFHAWRADVYEGAPTPVTAFMGMTVRIGLLAVMARVILKAFPGLDFFWDPVLSCVALFSIFVGGFGALVQTNIKRLCAYTVIAADGFALLALSASDASAFLFFLTTDAVLTAGLFAIVLSLRIGGDLSEEIRTLSGQARVKPVRGALFSLIFLGIAGLPPFAGFYGRFFVFKECVQDGRFAAVFAAMTGALVLAYVYLKIIRQIYFLPPKEELSAASGMMRAAIWVAALFSLLLTARAGSLWSVVKAAAVMGGG